MLFKVHSMSQFKLELFGGPSLARCDSVRFERFRRFCHLRKILFSDRSMKRISLSLSLFPKTKKQTEEEEEEERVGQK